MTWRLFSSTEEGFTLAEILVTIAIMAAIFPTLLKAFSDTSRNVARSDNRITALYLLKYQMAQIEMQGYPEVGQSGGEFGENSLFQWQSTVTEIDSDEIEGLRMIELTVLWEHLGKPQTMSMMTYMADREMQQGQGQQN